LASGIPMQRWSRSQFCLKVVGLTLGVIVAHGCATHSFTAASSRSVVYRGLPDAMAQAMAWQRRAMLGSDRASRSSAWMHCAAAAHTAMSSGSTHDQAMASTLATHCSGEAVRALVRGSAFTVTHGLTTIDDQSVDVQFRGLPSSLGSRIQLEPADDVSMASVGGARHVHAGFGVAFVAHSPRCAERPICLLYPVEGVFRPVTVWFEARTAAGDPAGSVTLVVQSPVLLPTHTAGAVLYPLAEDVSAPYASLIQHSKLKRLAWWGLLGGTAIGKRSGVYLLDDYDPSKTPIIMIHGLASSPVIWGPLSNAIVGDPRLDQHYQIWHVVYQSNAPLLVTRYRIQNYLDRAWQVLDPGGDAPARRHLIFVGHSMGGVIARLLCAHSTSALWNAAFREPLLALRGNEADIAVLRHTFNFRPYPGVDEAIFVAAPHHGSPQASGWLGRFVGVFASKQIPERAALARIARQNPQAVKPELLASFQLGKLSSLSTLFSGQAVSRIDDQLMPAIGVRYDTIAGVLPGKSPPGDGYVPLDSALLDGESSRLIVSSSHHGITSNKQAIDRIVEILREHVLPH
jgi:pimeloyl-ACP methyl ester carboxylesterase